jgi:dTDP-4-amino-4,6-dideoxygalactose transaminase
LEDIAAPDDFDLLDQRYQPPKFANASRYQQSTLSLPMFPQPPNEDVDYVMSALLGFSDAK